MLSIYLKDYILIMTYFSGKFSRIHLDNNKLSQFEANIFQTLLEKMAGNINDYVSIGGSKYLQIIIFQSYEN